MYKIIAVVGFLATANALPGEYQATSFASFNDNHNSVHHINAVPAPYKYAPAPSAYAAPTAAKVTFPVVSKVSVPSATFYQSAPAPKYSFSPAPIYAAPVATVSKYVSAPVAKYASGPAYSSLKEEYAPAQYEFAYAIEDPHTGDYHSQQEHRDGDHVVGQYSLHEADGTVRLVKYSDDGHGFNAVVEKQGEPTKAPVYKKVVALSAPSYKH